MKIVYFIFLFLSVEFLPAQALKYAYSFTDFYSTYGTSVTHDNAGNVIFTGSFSDTIDFDPGPGVYNLIATAGREDVFVSKLDANGNFLWAFSIGEGSSCFNQGCEIKVDAFDNIIVGGLFTDSADFDPGTGVFKLYADNYIRDMFVAKYTSAGTFIWAFAINASGVISPNELNGLVLDASGNIYIAGSFTVNADFDPSPAYFYLSTTGARQIYFAKYTPSGALSWAKQIGATNKEENAFCLAIDALSNIYIGGVFTGTSDFDPGTGTHNLTSAGLQDAFIAMYNTNGIYVFAKNMGQTGKHAWTTSITCNNTGSVFACGIFDGNSMDADPGFGTYFLSTNGYEDCFITSFSTSTGNLLWAESFGGAYNDGIGELVCQNGSLLACGRFGGTIDFDPGPTSFPVSSFAGDFFLSKYDFFGAFKGMFQLGDTTSYISGSCVSADNNGNFWITGSFHKDQTDFDPESGYVPLNSMANNTAFIAEYSSLTIGLNELTKTTTNDITLFPNPATNTLSITLNNNSTKEIYIADLTGRIVYSTKIESNTKENFTQTINIAELNAGYYNVNIKEPDTGIIKTSRFIKL